MVDLLRLATGNRGKVVRRSRPVAAVNRQTPLRQMARKHDNHMILILDNV